MNNAELADEIGQQLPASRNLHESLSRAEEYAARRKHSVVGLDHLMLALGQDPEALAILVACTVDVEALCMDLLRKLGPEAKFISPNAVPPNLDNTVQNLLNFTSATAQAADKTEIDSADIIKAIISGDAGLLTHRILEKHGLSFEQAAKVLKEEARRETAKSIDTAKPTARPEEATKKSDPEKRGATEEKAASDGKGKDQAGQPIASGQQAKKVSFGTSTPDLKNPAKTPQAEIRNVTPPGGNQLPDHDRTQTKDHLKDTIIQAEAHPSDYDMNNEDGAHKPMPPRQQLQPPIANRHAPRPDSGPPPTIPRDAPRAPHMQTPLAKGAPIMEMGQDRDKHNSEEKGATGQPFARRGLKPDTQNLTHGQPDQGQRPAPDRAKGATHPESFANYKHAEQPPIAKSRGFAPPPLPDKNNQPLPTMDQTRPAPPLTPEAAPLPDITPVPGPAPFADQNVKERPKAANEAATFVPPKAFVQNERPAPQDPYAPYPQGIMRQPQKAEQPPQPSGQHYNAPEIQIRDEASEPKAQKNSAPFNQNGENDLVLENIPKVMAVGKIHYLEVRVARFANAELDFGPDHYGLRAKDDKGPITKAITVRLTGPDGQFLIDSTTSSTQWSEIHKGVVDEADFAVWRWRVMPRRSGVKKLRLDITVRSSSDDGLTAEIPVQPTRTYTVKVTRNYLSILKKLMIIVSIFGIGFLIAKYGQETVTTLKTKIEALTQIEED